MNWHTNSPLSLVIPLALLTIGLYAAQALTTNSFVAEQSTDGSFCLFSEGAAARVFVDPDDWPGVVRAASDLRTDIRRVSGIAPELAHDAGEVGKTAILIGTLGKSPIIDRLVREEKINVRDIAGQWEATLLEVFNQPLPGVERALVIAGSDKRGTIYGIYELSEQMGVSPWHWWADAPPKTHERLFVRAGRHVLGPSAVKYRGIFINDEGPCLMTWARQKYGGLNHQMYTNVFELILRLQGNYLWPAMWDNSFATDDALNARLADEYGVVIGTSHHEPMMRAWKEWERAGNRKGTWDYSKNAEKLRAYWSEGLRRTRDYEKVITIGMRGDGDEPMSETESIALLEQIVGDQRKLIGEVINPSVEQVPQVWALYKEVMGYYEKGMRVPDDVILLWCDDNWGNIRRLPTLEERRRTGGAGIYYHFDYVGGPRNYKWVNTVPLPKIWEQMNLAWHYGVDKLWIANVGDIKPEEVPLEFFLTLGRNPAAWSKDSLNDYLRRWAAREFGPEHAADIADIIAKYAKYNGRRKPELLEPGTFSLENYNEADRVLAEWKAISDRAEAIYSALPEKMRDAFYQLVLYPTKASATVNALYVAVAKNRACAAKQDPRANQFARLARDLFQQDAEMADYYNRKVAGGKWNHMMDQTRIGYTGWQQPPRNVMPRVTEVSEQAPAAPAGTAVIDVEADLKPEHRAEPSEVQGAPKDWRGFVERDGYVAIEAEHFARSTSTTAARWELLPDHGRTLSAMTVFPNTAPSVIPPTDSPRLEYDMWLTSTGAVEVTAVVSPCLNFNPGRGVHLGVSFDDAAPQIITVVPKGYNAGDGNRDWEESVKDGVHKVRSTHNLAAAGAHALKVWMVDPAVVLQRILVDSGGMKPSYLGPPESERGSSSDGSGGPSAEISNGLLKMRVHLPDAKAGFYRGTRFDWSGVIEDLEYAGHNYYPQWFQRTDSSVPDFIYDGAEIVAGPCTAVTGPVEEFSSNGTGLGFAEAKAGETFIKIGVGVLRKPDDAKYSPYRLYPIQDGGKWTVTRTPGAVEFTQELADPSTGYAYVYRKTVKLTEGKPQMVLDHSLRNTGKRTIETSVYNHNFLYLDRQSPSPDFVIALPFNISAPRTTANRLAEIRTREISYAKTLTGEDSVYTGIEGFGPEAKDYDIRVENRRIGAGVRITADRPLSRLALWSIRASLSIEPFISMRIEPGTEFTWRISYDYYTIPKSGG